MMAIPSRTPARRRRKATDMPDLLLELFSEEIPARMQTRAAADLKKLVTDGLVEAGLTYASAGAFATPRRLCLTVEGLTGESPTVTEERKGPRADAPEKALEGFLRATGLTRDQLEERETPKGNILFARIEKPGRPAADIVAEASISISISSSLPSSRPWAGVSGSIPSSNASAARFSAACAARSSWTPRMAGSIIAIMCSM